MWKWPRDWNREIRETRENQQKQTKGTKSWLPRDTEFGLNAKRAKTAKAGARKMGLVFCACT
jgi:hypothetical protein